MAHNYKGNEPVEAPWTDDQVASLNAYQTSGVNPTIGLEKPWVATTAGWWDPHADTLAQTWAPAWMTDWRWKDAGARKVLGKHDNYRLGGPVYVPTWWDRSGNECVVLLGVPTKLYNYVPIFTSLDKLKKALTALNMSYVHHTERPGVQELLDTLPRAIRGQEVRVIVDLSVTESGSMTYIEIVPN